MIECGRLIAGDLGDALVGPRNQPLVDARHAFRLLGAGRPLTARAGDGHAGLPIAGLLGGWGEGGEDGGGLLVDAQVLPRLP